MKCNRLINLIKDWYLQVQNETMAPARMVAFMGQHIAECEECLADSDVACEVDKVREIVLPPSKVPKVKPKPKPKPDKSADDEDESVVDTASVDDEEQEDVYDDGDEDDEDEVGEVGEVGEDKED